jgi:hypothetical protein
MGQDGAAVGRCKEHMFRAVDKWLPGYIRWALQRTAGPEGTRHFIFALCDHFEPFRGNRDPASARKLVRDWIDEYPASVEGFLDQDGLPPRHTFFYPQEEYDPEILDRLADFCRLGYGEVEIHLHHRHDTAEGLREKLESFRDLLRTRHGLLGSDAAGRIRYGFIHGNWALCNARPDGDWCGVNEELGVLAETGCYADFTFPSAPSPTQPRIVNALYRARDRAGRPRSADRGERAKVGGGGDGTLLLITGPLGLNWSRRKWGLLPRLENADISGSNPPTADRIRLWARQAIHVAGRPDWVFVKTHTHGCLAANRRVVLGPAMREARAVLQRDFNDGQGWQLHYVTAREMFNLVKAAEAGVAAPVAVSRDCEVVLKGQEKDNATSS